MKWKSKPIMIEWASYCIQFEIGTETVKILKLIKISLSSEQIIIKLSILRELESNRTREFRNELAISKSPSRKKNTDFHMIQIKMILMKLWIWDTELVFICLHLNIY